MELKNLTRTELRKVAKGRGMKGYSKLSKSQLLIYLDGEGELSITQTKTQTETTQIKVSSSPKSIRNEVKTGRACPVCGAELIFDGFELYCTKDTCKYDKTIGDILDGYYEYRDIEKYDVAKETYDIEPESDSEVIARYIFDEGNATVGQIAIYFDFTIQQTYEYIKKLDMAGYIDVNMAATSKREINCRKIISEENPTSFSDYVYTLRHN